MLTLVDKGLRGGLSNTDSTEKNDLKRAENYLYQIYLSQGGRSRPPRFGLTNFVKSPYPYQILLIKSANINYTVIYKHM